MMPLKGLVRIKNHNVKKLELLKQQQVN